jgi:hypothetical protein
VRHHQPVRLAAVLVHHHEVREVVRPAQLDEVGEDLRASVHALRGWHEQFHLLDELRQAARRIS